MQNIHEINSSPNIYRGDQNPSNLNDTASGAYDEMYGYAGNDELWSDLATEVKLVGGLGWDYLWVRGSGWGLLQGDEGNDVLDGGFSSKADTLNGGDGDDILGGSAGLFDGDAGDLLDGGNGRDAMYGQLGNDTIFGGAGDDNHIGNMMITAGPRFLQAYGGLLWFMGA